MNLAIFQRSEIKIFNFCCEMPMFLFIRMLSEKKPCQMSWFIHVFIASYYKSHKEFDVSNIWIIQNDYIWKISQVYSILYYCLCSVLCNIEVQVPENVNNPMVDRFAKAYIFWLLSMPVICIDSIMTIAANKAQDQHQHKPKVRTFTVTAIFYPAWWVQTCKI